MSKRINIPDCCNAAFFSGDTKIIKIEVPEIENLSDFAVEFSIDSPYWALIKTRSTGITTLDNTINIRFESADTLGKAGVHKYRVKILSDSGDVSTVAYGNLTIS